MTAGKDHRTYDLSLALLWLFLPAGKSLVTYWPAPKNNHPCIDFAYRIS
jgi:hypothetical protein